MVFVKFCGGSVVETGSIPVAAHFRNIKSYGIFACVAW